MVLLLVKNTIFYHNLLHKNNIHCAKESKKNHKPHILYLEAKMPPTTTITRLCEITICQRQSTNWGKVTGNVLFKDHANVVCENENEILNGLGFGNLFVDWLI